MIYNAERGVNQMTLKEWEGWAGCPSTAHPDPSWSGCRIVLIEPGHRNAEHRSELFYLADYKVSSACGMAMWLVPWAPAGAVEPVAEREGIDAEHAAYGYPDSHYVD